MAPFAVKTDFPKQESNSYKLIFKHLNFLRNIISKKLKYIFRVNSFIYYKVIIFSNNYVVGGNSEINTGNKKDISSPIYPRGHIRAATPSG